MIIAGGCMSTFVKLQAIALVLGAVSLEGSVSGTSGGRTIKLTTDATGCAGAFAEDRATLTVDRLTGADVRIEITKTAVRVDGKQVAKLSEENRDIRLRYFDGILLLFVDGNLVETDS